MVSIPTHLDAFQRQLTRVSEPASRTFVVFASRRPLTRLVLPLAHRSQTLASVSDKVKNFAVIYCVDIDEVPDFNTMYELYDPCTVMFFFRNKHIQIDLGTGNNNKVNWAMDDKPVSYTHLTLPTILRV